MESILLVGIVFGAINLPSVGVWTVLGQQLKRFLTSDTYSEYYVYYSMKIWQKNEEWEIDAHHSAVVL